MFPWTHAAFGYALFVVVAGALVALGVRGRISRAELLAAVAATQLPDLVDKPLAWYFAVIPSGRSLGHSLIVTVPLSLAVLAVARHRGHAEVGLAFAVGYASHLLGDSYVALYYWRVEEFTFLLWPVLPAYPYDDFAGLGALVDGVALTAPLLAALALAAVGGLVFLGHFLRAPWWSPPRPD
ncbi:metal-dependent hydrolase [Haloarcula sediminis]|uniref:metal-dependent hydrolase n=1 Tax=Haloarcula sediminis TaxID=3111777 RepID=UPI002D784E06|nr:metal-dependent hydrolase [Haloarcula sp. CK38]